MFSGIDIHPNVYICYYGPSNDKKTTAQRRITNQNLLGDGHNIALLSTGSVQGMADLIAGNGSPVSSLMLAEELSSLYVEGHAEHSILLQFFTETFDCPDKWEKPYRKNPIALESPTPNILGCSTPTWFWKHARPDDFAGGFANRFFYLSGVKKDPIPEPTAPHAIDLAEARSTIQKLRNLPAGQVHWNKAAREQWEAFYKAFEGAERPPLLMEAVKRCPVYVRKLAMVYAALEDTLPEISAAQLKAAIAVISYGMECTERLIDLKSAGGRLNSHSELEIRVLGWVKKHGTAKVRDLQQTMSKYCDAETFNRVIRSLEVSDQIQTYWDKNTPPRRFISL
jgi:hypothetical protein